MIGRLSGVLGVGCLLMLAGAAAGQVDVPAEPSQKSADNAPLRGPRVRATAPPGARGRLVDGQTDRRERATPLRFYRAELRKMGSPKADDSIRLSDEQIKLFGMIGRPTRRIFLLASAPGAPACSLSAP